MRNVLLLCVWLLAAGLGIPAWAQAPGLPGIPTRMLPEVGYGPALLIGVKDYDSQGSRFDPLPGIEIDLSAIEQTVRKLGWTDVTVLQDPTLVQLRTAVDRFGPKARASSGASFFYYSGHGVLQEKLNYMVPARAQVRTRGHLSLYALPMEDVLAYLGGEGSGPALVFIDACRDNTLPAEDKNAAVDLLLSRRAGMFIGFATAEGAISNASEKGSLYTRSLAHRLLTPGFSLDDIYSGIIADVELASNNRADEIQPPEKLSGLRFVLHMVPQPQGQDPGRSGAQPPRFSAPTGAMALPATASAPPTVVPTRPAPAEDPFRMPPEMSPPLDLNSIFQNGPYARYNESARVGILRTVQTKLQASGDYSGTIDGEPGPGTHRAIIALQRRQGIAPTGRLDSLTLDKLGALGMAEAAPAVAAVAAMVPAEKGSRSFNGTWSGQVVNRNQFDSGKSTNATMTITGDDVTLAIGQVRHRGKILSSSASGLTVSLHDPLLGKNLTRSLTFDGSSLTWNDAGFTGFGSSGKVRRK